MQIQSKVISLNKTIAYSKTWKKTFYTGVILGAIVAGIIIFLKPFDSANFTASYKNLRLAGYTLCVLLPILLLHPLENAWFKRQHNRWYVYNEIIYVIAALLFILLLSATYAFFVVNESSGITVRFYKDFYRYFGLPFAPIVLPIWWYLRSNFGSIEVPSVKELSTDSLITILGESKQEKLSLAFSKFIYAQAQQNYVVIHYLNEEELQQKMIRSTLSNLRSQVPDAWQVHRSFLVNLDYLKTVEGNARKRFVSLSVASDAIPISQKYYDALRKRLSNSSQNLQN